MLTIVAQVLRTMNIELGRIETCLNSITDEQVWSRIRPNLNSIGNLCVHLAGNEYQHFVSGIGQKPLIRERTLEFTSNGGYSKDGLIHLLRSVRNEATLELEKINEADLHEDVTVHYSLEDWNKMKERTEADSEPYYKRQLLTVLFQVCEHYGYHVGQIVIITKLLNPKTETISGYRH